MAHATRPTLLTALLAGLASSASAQPTATFSYLPDGCVSANDMTPDGRYIVGGHDSDGNGLPDGSYLYDTLLDDLNVFSLADGSDASAISDDGTVITGDIQTVDGEVAGRWTQATGWQSLGFLPNALSCPSRSNGYEISGDGGTIVGLSWDGCSGVGFQWNEIDEMTGLEVLALGSNRASVISGDGTVIAGFCQTQARTPCFWDSATGAGTIIDPNGTGTYGEVRGTSEDGSTLLMTYYDNAFPTKDGWFDAYKWTAASGPEIIGTGSIVGGWAGAPMDIAEDTGTIVGFDFLLGNRRAWIQPDGVGPCLELVAYINSIGGAIPVDQYLHVVQTITNDGTRLIGHTAGTTAWTITFDYGCQADMNGDGILDNGDIGAFVAAFLAQDLAADFNGDGILDNGDIGAFVAGFLAGC